MISRASSRGRQARAGGQANSIETAWAPQWVGDELRQVRAGAREADLAAARADADAAAAESSGHHQVAARRRVLAASYQAMGEAYRDRERVFAGVMADRADWEAATRAQRHLAVAADAELRRRHPQQRFTLLRSAEPPVVTDARRAELTLTAGPDLPDAGSWFRDLDAGHRRFAARLVDRQSLAIPAEDPDYGDLGQAFPPGPDPPAMRSCSRRNHRSVPRPASSSAPRTVRPTSKPGNDSGPVHPGREGPTAIVARMMMDASKSRRRPPRLLARIITGIR